MVIRLKKNTREENHKSIYCANQCTKQITWKGQEKPLKPVAVVSMIPQPKDQGLTMSVPCAAFCQTYVFLVDVAILVNCLSGKQMLLYLRNSLYNCNLESYTDYCHPVVWRVVCSSCGVLKHNFSTQTKVM